MHLQNFYSTTLTKFCCSDTPASNFEVAILTEESDVYPPRLVGNDDNIKTRTHIELHRLRN
jgi:hypothetical protein